MATEDKKKKSREVQPTVLEWSRYLVLDKCLRDQHKFYYKDDLVKAVNRMLERYGFTPVSQRTVEDDLKFMQSGEGFGAMLAKRYDGHTKIYTYEDPHYSIMKMPMTDRESDLLSATIMMLSRFRGMPNYAWLENTLRMLRVKFNVGAKTASVAMDQNKGLKGLDDWFEPLFEACRKRLIVTMKYSRFDRLDKEPATRVVKPYQMRQHNNRWYLVGHEDAKDVHGLEMVVVPIDRIQALDIESVEDRDIRESKDGRFVVPSETKIEEWFKDVVGVSRAPRGKVTTVKVKAWGLTSHYIDTKPIHPSQEVIEEGTMTVHYNNRKGKASDTVEVNYKVFEWHVIPNEPFQQAMLIFGNEGEILEPAWFRKKVCERAKDIVRNNENDNQHENDI
jgi:predicted DNA-binding transcriptional regulator YafY